MKTPNSSYIWKAYVASAATVAAILFCSKNHLLLTAVLLVILVALALSDRSVSPLFYVLVGVGGLAAEAVCIYLGVHAWGYRDHRFAGVVPYWLAPMWALVGGGVLATYVLAGTIGTA